MLRSSGAKSVEKIKKAAMLTVMIPVLFERNRRHANSRGLRPTILEVDSIALSTSA